MAGGSKHDAEDERLLARTEEALTEIKVSKGLSERHEAVLAALRIRLKGDAGSSLEDLLTAAEDAQDPQGSELDNLIGSKSKPSSSFDDLLSKAEKPKRSLDDLLGSGGDEPEHPDP
ncbi:MAG: hypothetical protein M3P11_11000 [Actinomycetota bacterium]|nr:hypothetical protein [Actinomycetota bacterium]